MQRSTWHHERSGTMTREKRGLDPGEDNEGGVPETKRRKVPALASVIVEALKLDSLQKLCSSLEPVLRRIVSEEVERALAKLDPARLGARSSPKRLEGPNGRNLRLQFKSRLSLPIFTGGKVEGDQGAAIHIVLVDANNGHVVTSGLESSAKLDILVLEGDFNKEEDDDWDEEEFESHVVREREGKRPLLTGDLQVSLKEGVGTIGELIFTDNSSWIRSRKFRLGLKIASGCCEGIRIREGKTEAFTVKDHRGELYKKHYPPALKDDVWRLEKIGKDGAFHKKLNKASIYSVEDFLRLFVRDPQRLRNILGSGMSNKMWDVLVEHAKTCVLSGKFYVYYSEETRNVGAIFNNIYEFAGLIAGGQYLSAESLNESQKIFADTLVKKAYEKWMNVVEYDGKALLNIRQNKKAIYSEPLSAPSSNPASFTQPVSQVPQQRLPAPVAVHQPSVDTAVAVGGGVVDTTYDGHQSNIHPIQTQQINSNDHMQFNNSLLASQTQFNSSSHQTQMTINNTAGLALGLTQPTSLDYQPAAQSLQSLNVNSFDNFLPEDEIRMRSHEILENYDMQHLLRVFSMGGAATNNIQEDGYGFTPYTPLFSNYGFDEERNQSSGKAVIGWLKIKAAMRWGIFIRKKAAERRAHLVELEDA
ncbi:calmodulin-binding protein 60 B-like isoform X2 [Phalaenopsis equestris]|uniref:calmodulin-binding protein 60 B-like isoform X2 n=1 Tax=Phalaenopsis equestris TaxID=78828 RepID=UPI0009E2FC96|nr:calmodulin-binding protein 60 B-like isoform X2 [Phalaenopsis equestris]